MGPSANLTTRVGSSTNLTDSSGVTIDIESTTWRS